jgi:hypothetical protein
LANKITESPWQNVVGPPAEAIAGAAGGFIVTMAGADTNEPQALLTVTEIFEVPELETAIVWVVAPFDHK